MPVELGHSHDGWVPSRRPPDSTAARGYGSEPRSETILLEAGAPLPHHTIPRSSGAPPTSPSPSAVDDHAGRVPAGSVVIAVVTYDSAAVVGDFLGSLRSGAAGLPRWELVVVDNASSDETLALVRVEAPDARIIQLGSNRGYAAAINAAAAAILPGSPLVVTNPDVRLTPGALAGLLATADRTGAGIVVPKLRTATGEVSPSLRRQPSIRRALAEALIGGRLAGRLGSLGETVTDPAAYETEQRPDWASGAIMLISAACRAAVGPWDERFFLYSEETDYALRARDHGFEVVYDPSVVVTHLGGEAQVAPRLWSLLVCNRVRLFRKRRGPVAAAIFWAILLLRELIRTPRAATHRAAAAALLRLPLTSDGAKAW